MTDRTVDVAIVGGGPAGATLAALLAQRGRRALIVERADFPRFHIGESLLPCSCSVFERLDLIDTLDQRYIRKFGARFLCAETGRRSSYRFADAFNPQSDHAYEVERASFDALLLERARELGAEVMQPWSAHEVLFEGDRAVGIRARHAQGEGETTVRARVVVDASGRDALLARRGAQRFRLDGLDSSAFFAPYEGVRRQGGAEEGDITVILFEHGWMWCIPFKGETTSVGVVVTRAGLRGKRKDETSEEFFERMLASTVVYDELFSGARRCGEVRAAADFSYGVEQLAGDGWLAVGDAAGFIDPLFSSGVHLALRGADVAAGAIDGALTADDTSRASFEHYEKTMRQASELFLGTVQSFYEGTFREMLFEGQQRQTLRKLITSLLSGDVVHTGRPPAWVRFVRAQYGARYPEPARVSAGKPMPSRV